jgi:dnd system-associated protein 4
MIRRISYAQCHDELVSELWPNKDNTDATGPFDSKAKCLIYAASFGAEFGFDKGRKKLPERRSEGIRYDVFSGCSGFEDFICSLAVFATQDIKILEGDDETTNKRITIFEEFANYGLERLKAELKGEHNKTEGLTILLSKKYSDLVAEDGINWDKIESL